MTLTVRQLAELVRGAIVGDGDLVIQGARILHEAKPGDITFLDNPKQAGKLQQSNASAAVVAADVLPAGKTLIQVADPLMAFAVIVQTLQNKGVQAPTGIDVNAVVHPSARIGAEPSIQPFAVIAESTVIGNRCRLHSGVAIGKNCRLGDDVVVHPNVVIYDDTIIGDRVIIHANATIGADGFGYRMQKGRHVKVPQVGNVVLGADVEIGAGTTIDRATFGSTVIGEGTKIDNLVQIAHNCQIGKHAVFAAQVGIGGSCVIGDYVAMGGQVGVSDHLHVGAGAMLGAKTGAVQDVPAGKRMFLYPAHEDKEACRIVACLKKLPGMRRDLLRVLKELNLIEGQGASVDRRAEKPAA